MWFYLYASKDRALAGVCMCVDGAASVESERERVQKEEAHLMPLIITPRNEKYAFTSFVCEYVAIL